MTGEQILLRIFTLSTDQVHQGVSALWGTPAYEWIVRQARHRHQAGATVLRGIFGFGRRGLSPQPGWHLAHGMPVIVELVDAPETIARFCEEEILPNLRHGTATLEWAAVMRYRHEGGDKPRPPAMFEQIRSLSTVPAIGGSASMKTQSDGILLRIFADDSDTHGGRPLHEAIVHKAREMGLAGATVLKGTMGFGAHSVLHTAKVLELSSDLPMVIEIADSQAAIERLLPEIEGMIKEGMVTMESVRIIRVGEDRSIKE